MYDTVNSIAAVPAAVVFRPNGRVCESRLPKRFSRAAETANPNMFALLMQKYVAVTQRGLEIFHEMHITTNYERWDWADIYAVTHEIDPGGSGRTILYFTRGDRTKRNYYNTADVPQILKLAKKQNPNIRIFDGKEARDKAKALRQKKK